MHSACNVCNAGVWHACDVYGMGARYYVWCGDVCGLNGIWVFVGYM